MRNIARLLFGPEGDRLLDLFAPGDRERDLAEQARQAGEWCQSTPGRSRPQSRPRHSQPTLGPRRGRG